VSRTLLLSVLSVLVACALARAAHPLIDPSGVPTGALARASLTRPVAADARAWRAKTQLGPAAASRWRTGRVQVLMGMNAVAARAARAGADVALAFRFISTKSGVATTIMLYVDARSRVRSVLVALYSDRRGRIGRRLSFGTRARVARGRWNPVAIAPVAVRTRAAYWLVVRGRGGTLYLRARRRGECASRFVPLAAAGGSANLWPATLRWSTCSPSAYVQGIVSAAKSATSSGAATPTVTGASGSATVAPTPGVSPPAPVASAPVNTVPPQISGTPIVGYPLTTSNGSWSSSPTTYAYQWEDCDASAGGCLPIPGAVFNHYTPASTDVGHTLRAVVTAIAPGGAGSATSPPTAAVLAAPPPAPQAAFSFSPASPLTGQSVHFDGSASSCQAAPCSYSWADDPPSGGSWPLGNGQSIDFTFQGAGTKYVTLTVTDSLNRTSSVEHNVVVATGPPTNTSAPTISGTAQQGQTLTASPGSWSGSPTSYAYQWQDCQSSSCTNISGATGSTYTLQSADVGKTIDVVVTASNSAGSGSATSAQTAAVTAASSGGGGASGTCLELQSGGMYPVYAQLDGCGYPSPDTAGVPAGTNLQNPATCNCLPPNTSYSNGGLSINGPTTVNGLSLDPGWIVVNTTAPVTIENTLVVSPGGDGGAAVHLDGAGDNVTIKYSTIGGADSGIGPGNAGDDCTGPANNSDIGFGTAVIDHDVLVCAGEPINSLSPGSQVTNSYVMVDGAPSGSHNEDIYMDGGSSGITIEHNTFLDPVLSTATIFGDAKNGSLSNITIENNLLAGGQYGDGTISMACGTSTNVLVENNRLSAAYQSPLDPGSIDPAATWSGNYQDGSGTTVPDPVRSSC